MMNRSQKTTCFRWLAGVVLILIGLPKVAQADGISLSACPLPSAIFVLCFDDLTDGAPTVLTNIPGVSVGTGFESATVSFTSVPIAGPFPQSYALLETAGDFNPPNSDVATIFGPGSVIFQSDVFSSPPTFGLTSTLVEDGGFQEFIVNPGFEILIRSDVGGPDPTSTAPEPTTLLLLGTGALTGAVIRRRRTKRAVTRSI
jgi:hypothetical protein